MMKNNPVFQPRRERTGAQKPGEGKGDFKKPPFLDEGNLRPLREVKPEFADIADRLIAKSGLGTVETCVYPDRYNNAVAIRETPNRIAYSDQMVSKFSEAAFAQVTGHELGHVFIFGKRLGKLYNWVCQLTEELPRFFGTRVADIYLQISGLESVKNLMSRRIERKADEFGVKLVGTTEGVHEKYSLILKDAENYYAKNSQEWGWKKKRDYRVGCFDHSSFDRNSPIAPKNIFEKAEAIANHFVFGSYPTFASRMKHAEKIAREINAKETPEKAQTH
jgi:Zn-dependent protease with chaperone function